MKKWVLLVLIFTLVFYGCSNKETVSQIPENTIIIKNFEFNPSEITIQQGTTLKWINEDSAPHNIKSDIINSDTFGLGGLFEFKFENTGIYDYICGIHPYMKGRVIVE